MTDLTKLLKFAKLIEVPVKFKGKHKRDAGIFLYEGEQSSIEIFLPKSNKDEVVLALLHELGHAIHWIRMGRPTAEVIPKAMRSAKTYEDRRVVYHYEQYAVGQAGILHKLLKLKLPSEVLDFDNALDMWNAGVFLETGKYPTLKQCEAYLEKARNI